MKPETGNKKLKGKRREQWMLYAPLIIWIGVIFFLSSGQGSSTRTSLIIRPILEFLFPSADSETLSFYHGIIRKFAHLTEYAILAFLACRAFAPSSLAPLRKHFYFAAIFLVLLIAGLDEFNQSFNPERTGTPVDTLLDLSGGITATVLYYLFSKREGQPFSERV